MLRDERRDNTPILEGHDMRDHRDRYREPDPGKYQEQGQTEAIPITARIPMPRSGRTSCSRQNDWPSPPLIGLPSISAATTPADGEADEGRGDAPGGGRRSGTALSEGGRQLEELLAGHGLQHVRVVEAESSRNSLAPVA